MNLISFETSRISERENPSGQGWNNRYERDEERERETKINFLRSMRKSTQERERKKEKKKKTLKRE